MADMQGSESKYAGSSTQGNKGQGAKAQSAPFGATIVAPPISGPMQNIVPGSQEWINARMASIIEQLKRNYGDQAARRGMLQSGGAEQELEKAIAEQERQVQAEAGQYNADIANREDAQLHENKMADKANKSQERAAAFSGLGSMAPTLLAGKWGRDIPAEPLYDVNAAGEQVRRLNPDGTQAHTAGKESQSLLGKGWEGLKNTLGAGPASAPVAGSAAPSVGGWDRLKAGALGTGVGTMLGSNKNKATGLLAGGVTTGLAGMGNMSQGATAGLSGLASGMAGSIKGNMLSGKNWWKTLLAGGAGAAAAGAFGRF